MTKKKPARELLKVYRDIGGNTTIKTKKPRQGERWRERIVRTYFWRD